jgi:hypothetical protein
MNFKNLIRTAEQEANSRDNRYINIILDSIIQNLNNNVHNNSSIIKEEIKDIKKDIVEYTNKKSKNSIKTKTIEYYLGKRSYSHSKYNLSSAYRELSMEYDNGIRDAKEDDKDIQYTYSMDENMKLLVAGIMSKIKQDKSKLNKFLNNHDVLKNYYSLDKKTKERLIRLVSDGNINAQKAYKKLMAFGDKSDRELVEAEVKKYTQKSSDELKSECINSIRNDVELLDKYGILRNMIEANNTFNKSIYLFNCDYSYEETMELLSEKKLKDLSVEQLIGMNAHWDNRTAKVIRELNKAVYILSHPKLYESKLSEDGKISINVSDETIKNVNLKINILQKICFEIFDEAEWINKDDDKDNNKDEKNDNTIDISYEIDTICQKYDKEYREYLDQKFEYVKNDLREDVMETLNMENLIYNLYSTKAYNIQALLISVLNGDSEYIQNYGCIEEEQKKDGFALLRIDIHGMNMSLGLHTAEKNVLEVLESAKSGDKKFPKYIGSNDFYYFSDRKIMPTQIFLPVSKEKAKKYKEEVKKVNEKDKYGNTIKHIGYIVLNGKMPEHMIKEKSREEQMEI